MEPVKKCSCDGVPLVRIEGLAGVAFWLGLWVAIVVCSGDPDLIDMIGAWIQRQP